MHQRPRDFRRTLDATAIRHRIASAAGVARQAALVDALHDAGVTKQRKRDVKTQVDAAPTAEPKVIRHVLGLVHFTLPDDAIDSVAVMPNPYAVEYGRFTSGLVVIQTRRGGDAWHTRLNNLSPTFRSKRHEDLYNINGIAGFGPNFELGGPIVKDRVFLEQTAQYRFSSDDVASRPEDERRVTHWVSSFTRVDANLTAKHSLVGTAGFFPSITTMASGFSLARMPLAAAAQSAGSPLG